MSNVQYGISPLTWTNDDMPELGGDIPLETCLSEMAEAGLPAQNWAPNTHVNLKC